MPQQDLAPILISPLHTYIHNHGNDDPSDTSEDDTQAYWNKSNADKLCETK